MRLRDLKALEPAATLQSYRVKPQSCNMLSPLHVDSRFDAVVICWIRPGPEPAQDWTRRLRR